MCRTALLPYGLAAACPDRYSRASAPSQPSSVRRRDASPRALLSAALLLLAAGRPTAAYGQNFADSKAAPTTVTADPLEQPVGLTVTFRGTTIAKDATRPVNLTVTWLRTTVPNTTTPPPPAVTLTARYQPDGRFQATFEPRQEGVYRVDAVSPDGSGRASAEFRVTPMSELGEADSVAALLDDTGKLLEALAKVVSAQPPSPAKQEVEARLPKLQAELDRRKSEIRNLREPLATLRRLEVEVPEIRPGLKPMEDSLAASRREMRQLHERLTRKLTEGRASTRLCDQLVIVEEGFKLASAIFNLNASLAQMVEGYSNDVFAWFAGLNAPSWCGDACKLGMGSAIKSRGWVKPALEQAKAGSFDWREYAGNLPGLLSDVGAYATRKLFDSYCERFEGKIVGLMQAEFATTAGEVWWKYSTQLDGVMTLVYRKGGDVNRGGIEVWGHIAGTGSKFDVWEDALRVLKGHVLKGAVVRGRTTPPDGIPYLDFEGLAALQLVPTSFFIPIEGEIRDRKLVLVLGPARTDFNELYTVATGNYYISGGYAGAMGGYTSFNLPYKKAHFIIETATRAYKGPFEIPIVVGQDLMTARKEFVDKSGTPKGHADYHLTVSLCNPAC
ncbi:MAG TPA: hypothetical protein VFY20_14575 [Gemmatimonadales bacterium]|nr:hypothetical protein [Gemmatimonadales bacterium]